MQSHEGDQGRQPSRFNQSRCNRFWCLHPLIPFERITKQANQLNPDKRGVSGPRATVKQPPQPGLAYLHVVPWAGPTNLMRVTGHPFRSDQAKAANQTANPPKSAQARRARSGAFDRLGSADAVHVVFKRVSNGLKRIFRATRRSLVGSVASGCGLALAGLTCAPLDTRALQGETYPAAAHSAVGIDSPETEAQMRPSSDAGVFLCPHRRAHTTHLYGGRCAEAARLAGPLSGLSTAYCLPPCLIAGWRSLTQRIAS